MKNKFYNLLNTIIFVIALNFTTSTAIAQNTTNIQRNNNNKLNYKIPFKIPVSVFNKFRLTENTKVKRVYSDSNVVEYDRNYTYYYHLRAISFPEDGYQKVYASFDSCEYNFNSGKKMVRFISQDDEAVPPLNERDFLLFIQPLGKTFEALYSNYGQVAKIQGDDLNEKRDQIKNDIKKYDNPERLEAILAKLSDLELVKLIDPIKNLLPSFSVDFDTTWNRDLDFNLDVINVRGNSKVNLVDYRNNAYKLNCQMDSLYTDQKTFRLPEMNKEAELLEFKGNGNYELEISYVGAPSYAKANLNSIIKGKITNTQFTQFTETILIWDLMEKTVYK